MKKLLYILTPFVLAVFLFVAAPSVSAESSIQRGIDAARGDGQPADLLGDNGILTSVTNVLLFIVGALSVIMIIWGGIRYAVSGGSGSAVSAAKNTIMYALIGLVIAFLAFAIVNFVLSAVAPGGGAGFTDV